MVALSLPASIAALLASAGVIALFGTRLTALADRLADRTGLGEAFMGGVFLGAVTSLPGITASVTAAARGDAELALANAIGGIAAQTAFLAVADLAHRRANLEHAAASVPNLMQASLLVVLLGLFVVGAATPAWSLLGVHPLTPVLLVAYLAGMRMIRAAHHAPLWRPQMTERTETDVPDEPRAPAGGNVGMWLRFGASAVLVVAAGWLVTLAATSFADHTGLSRSLAGAVLTAVSTSLPELVTAVAAVKRGALTLAVGGVVGGNCFDTLFAAVADVAYRDGSLYHAASHRETVLVAVTLVMTAVLLLGLLRRQTHGPGGIGFEGVLIAGLYAGALALVAAT